MASELIAEAITDYFGERCLDYAEGCPTCEAWAEYDRWNTRPAPAATDTVLETYEPYLEVIDTGIGSFEEASMRKSSDGSYVHIDQAEELLTAEREEKEEWRKRYHATHERLLEADEKLHALEAKLAAANDLVVRAQVIIPDHYVNWHRDARAVLGVKPSC